MVLNVFVDPITNRWYLMTLYIVRCSEMARDGFQPHLTKRKILMCFHYSLQIIIIGVFDKLDCKCSIMLYYYLSLEYHTDVLFFILLSQCEKDNRHRSLAFWSPNQYPMNYSTGQLLESLDSFPKSSPTSLLSLLGSFLCGIYFLPFFRLNRN